MCAYCRPFLDSECRTRLGSRHMRSGLCPRPQTPSLALSRSTSRVSSTLLPVVLALILLPAVAFASPPDPSWITGIYDGADGDDIVSLVYETSAASAGLPSHLGLLPFLLQISLESIVRSVSDRHFTPGPRSPPVLFSLEFTYVFDSLPPPSGTDAPVSPPSITKFPDPRLATFPHLASQRL